MPLRTAACAGLASVLLLVPISVLLIATDYPFADASTDEVIQYLDDHRSAFMVAIIIELVSVSLLVVFVAGIAHHVPRSVALLTLATGTSAALLIGLEITTLAAAAFRPSPGAIDALWPLAHFGIGVLLHVANAVFVAVATLGFVGTGGLIGDSRSRVAVTVVGIIATVGSASIPFGYLGHGVDFVAGFAEHAISTVPYALWVAVSGTAIIASETSAASPATSRE